MVSVVSLVVCNYYPVKTWKTLERYLVKMCAFTTLNLIRERFWTHCEFLAAIFSIHLVRIWQRCLRKGTYSQSKAIESVRKKILDSSHWSQYVLDGVEHLWASEFESFLENFEMQKLKIIQSRMVFNLIKFGLFEKHT